MIKVLICINTCNRIDEVKKFIWNYIDFCNSNSEFDFILALDGNDEEYISFCESYSIPLIYSDEREGVGISKNRVLTQCPEYDYYFFIEDDIELNNGAIFPLFISLHKKTGYHHFCNNHIKNQTHIEYIEALGLNICHSLSGGAQFAFYTKKGLETVGGWHTIFAKYKRFGHTEHTYRFVNANLQPSPFIFPQEMNTNYFIIHTPPAVSQNNVKTNENELIEDEQELIHQKLIRFPIETISKIHFNNMSFGYNEKVALFLKNHKKKYPLTHGKKRRIALAEYHALKLQSKDSFFIKAMHFCLSLFYYPYNNALKHIIKTKLISK